MAKKRKSKSVRDDVDNDEEDGEWFEDEHPEPAEEPAAAHQSVSPELAKAQQLAQKLPEMTEKLAAFEPAGRVAESDQKMFSDEQKAGQEAVAEAQERK
jgi:hypothetical protein